MVCPNNMGVGVAFANTSLDSGERVLPSLWIEPVCFVQHNKGGGRESGRGERPGIEGVKVLDRIEAQFRVRQFLECGLEAAAVGEAAHASSRDRDGFIDLPGHEAGIDIDIAEVVHDHANACGGVSQQMVDQGGLPGIKEPGNRHRRYKAAHEILPLSLY
jgi:hypothetical protein